MSNNISTEERIDNYLLGRMSAEEKHQFEIELENDASLKDQFESQREIAIAVQKVALRDFLDQQRDLLNKQKEQKKTRFLFAPSHRVLWTITSIAAMFILIIGGYDYTSTLNTMKAEGQAAYQGISAPVARDGNMIDILIEKAYKEIGYEQYDHALETISKARDMVIAQLSLHSANTEEDEYDHQILKIQKDELDLYEVVILLKQGKVIKAKKILEKMADSDSYNADKASKYLNTIFK